MKTNTQQLYECSDCGEMFAELTAVQYAVGSTGGVCQGCLKDGYEAQPTVSADGMAAAHWRKGE